MVISVSFLLKKLIQRLGLGLRSGKAVEYKALRFGVFVYFRLQHLDGYFIGNEISRVDIPLSELSEFGFRL